MAYKTTIRGAEVFKVDADCFFLGASAQGYTLKTSVDGTNWDGPTYTVEAGKAEGFGPCPRGVYYKCDGNTDDIEITY